MCPFCGRRISRAIKNGITTCNSCHRVFDSSPYHKMLAAAWMARRENVYDLEALTACFELTPCEAAIIQRYIIDEDYCHDDFLKVISQKTCIDCI